MKLNSTTLTFLFIAVFTSCASKSDKIAATLQQVEKCIETHPDSALHILNGISNPDKLREKDLADYLLLLTQARDKNYMDITADSSITFAINYYKKNGDKRRVWQGVVLLWPCTSRKTKDNSSYGCFFRCSTNFGEN